MWNNSKKRFFKKFNVLAWQIKKLAPLCHLQNAKGNCTGPRNQSLGALVVQVKVKLTTSFRQDMQEIRPQLWGSSSPRGKTWLRITSDLCGLSAALPHRAVVKITTGTASSTYLFTSCWRPYSYFSNYETNTPWDKYSCKV